MIIPRTLFTCRPPPPKRTAGSGPGEPEPGAPCWDARGDGALSERMLVEDRATRSTPRLPRTDEWCSAGTSDPGIPSVVLSTSGASSGEVSRAACSSLSQTVCAPRCSWLGEGFVVLRRARFAEYSLCHHVCRIFHRRRRNEFLLLSPRWPTEHAPMAPLVARSPSSPRGASTERRVWRDLRGQHLDPLESPPCSRGADESFRVFSDVVSKR